MNKPPVCVTKQIYLQSDNALQIRLSRIKEKEHFFIADINDRKKMSKTLNKHITVLDNPDKILLVLSGADSGVSLFSFTIVIGIPVGITNASLVFLSLIEL